MPKRPRIRIDTSKAATYGRRKRKYRRAIGYATSIVKRNPMPNTCVKKFVYCDVLNYNPEVGGTVAVATWRANDLYDPYQGTGGHQPRGFDQIMAFYNQFCVISSKIRVDFSPVASGATNDGIIYGINLKDQNDAVQSNYVEYIENGNCNYHVSDINVKNLPVRNKFSLKKWTGVKDPYSLGSWSGDASASPSREAYYDVWIGAADQATDLPSFTATIYMEYIAILREPKLVPAS